MERRNLDSIQVGRGLAAIGVLLFHTNITLNLEKYLGINIFPIFESGDSGVMYFFVLSGFVIYLAHKNDFEVKGKLKLFLWKRFQRIYPTLWAALILVMPLIVFVMKYKLEAYDVLSSFLLIPEDKEKIIATIWTLRHEVLFYAIFAVAIWNKKIGIAVAAIWLGLSVASPAFGWSYPLSFIFDPVHILFAMGVLAYWLYARQTLKFPALWLTAGVLIFSATWVATAFNFLAKTEIATYLYGLGALLIILGGVALERQKPIAFPKSLMFLGDASYSIYLIHFPAVSGFCKIAMVLDRFNVPPQIIFVFVALGGLACGIIFYVFVEKPMMRALKNLKLFQAA